MEFFEQHQITVVLVVVLSIWFGFLGYLFRIDGKLTKLESLIKKEGNQ